MAPSAGFMSHNYHYWSLLCTGHGLFSLPFTGSSFDLFLGQVEHEIAFIMRYLL